MSKLVEIEFHDVSEMPVVCMRTGYGGDDAALYLNATPGDRSARIVVRSAAEAREYAVALRGAAEALVDWALTQEQPQNFATDDGARTYRVEASLNLAPADRALSAGLDMLKQAGVKTP